MDDNYVSPYGFSTVTDTCLDAIALGAGRDLAGFAAAIDDLDEEQRERFEMRVDAWAGTELVLALEKLADLVNEYVELRAL